ncbi:hypothetical protein HID58_074435 [Brassica napus]|uniref:gluconokinase n=1 Tax=Brassica napus TaxID=3708 RepID=A0ABQ7YH01_BRANA|nr:hypothetical protein HID58_074435 [Brassica napus]
MRQGIAILDEDRIPWLEKFMRESYSSCKAKIVLLEGNADVIAARLQKRASKGEHFIPLTLLHSQLELLQADD